MLNSERRRRDSSTATTPDDDGQPVVGVRDQRRSARATNVGTWGWGTMQQSNQMIWHHLVRNKVDSINNNTCNEIDTKETEEAAM